MATFNDTFLKLAGKKEVPYTPVWFMRQAGRYMSEYQAIRKNHSILDIARTPELAAEVTLQPLDVLGVDAAILFADILLPLEPMGCPFSFKKGEGPVIHQPIRTHQDIQHLKEIQAANELSFVGQTLQILSRELKEKVPIIGFAGGPFTLASYMIEGGSSRHYQYCKTLMWENPQAWHEFLEKIAKVTLDYLLFQIESGAQAVQLFDSWMGVLSPSDYEQFVFPHSQFIFKNLQEKCPDIPRIHFGTGTSMLLALMEKTGANVIGLDWRTPLTFGHQVLSKNVAIQGNLDPLTLFAPPALLKEKVKEILRAQNGQKGHIFNLGHGILPQTPVENVQLVVQEVHRLSKK